MAGDSGGGGFDLLLLPPRVTRGRQVAAAAGTRSADRGRFSSRAPFLRVIGAAALPRICPLLVCDWLPLQANAASLAP
eukprot:9487299-Pyramimonas_sp.AAC.1